jgi:Homeodomain-like domain
VHLNLNLDQLKLDQLQAAIRANQVSFPSQVPVFVKHGGEKLQGRVVVLYFVMGWSCSKIAKRYDVTRQHIWQAVNEWRRHAIALGYVQAIPPPEVLMPVRMARAAVPLPVMAPRRVRIPVQAPQEVPVLA